MSHSTDFQSDRCFRYRYSKQVSAKQAESTVAIAVVATEAINGTAETRLHARYFLNSGKRTIVVDGSTTAGMDLNRLIAHFFEREFGPDSFSVERVTSDNLSPHDTHST